MVQMDCSHQKLMRLSDSGVKWPNLGRLTGQDRACLQGARCGFTSRQAGRTRGARLAGLAGLASRHRHRRRDRHRHLKCPECLDWRRAAVNRRTCTPAAQRH